jgi:hypothetical protein
MGQETSAVKQYLEGNILSKWKVNTAVMICSHKAY